MIRISHSEWLIWATAVMNNPGVIAAPDRRIGRAAKAVARTRPDGNRETEALLLR
jgi:hypothetical protein